MRELKSRCVWLYLLGGRDRWDVRSRDGAYACHEGGEGDEFKLHGGDELTRRRKAWMCA